MTEAPKKERARRRTKEEMAAAKAAKENGGTPPTTPQTQAPAANSPGVELNALAEAIKWIDMAQSDDNLRPVYETHCLVTNGWLLAYNGVITAGHVCPLDGFYAPQTSRFLAAMTRAGKGLSVTTEQDGSLIVAGKSFRARVPVLQGGAVQVPVPEQPMWNMGDLIATAIEAVLPLTRAGADTVLESSIMLTTYGTALVTNRQVCLEAYHGFQLPADIIIPRQMATLMRGKEGIYGVGISDNAVTFWYGPNKFLRCQLHEPTSWPPIASFNGILNEPEGTARVEVPKSLASAVEAVEAHTADGALYLNENAVLSARTKVEAEAYHDCAGLPGELSSYNARNLAFLTKHAVTMAWLDDKALIWGEFKGIPMRGAVTARSL